jgi:hypothetical protein
MLIFILRCRYWKLTIDEVEKLRYDPSKVLLWEIKGIREPEQDAQFIGVFLYRHGTPIDYTPVKGITFYYNNLERKEIPEITKFLKKKFGGKDMEKGERILLKESKEIYTGKEIAELAKEMKSNFSVNPVITIEFQDISEQEQKDAGLPEEKLLPIPTK